MDFTAILIGLGVIVALIIIGKIFSILTKILFVIILIAAIAAVVFFNTNYGTELLQNKQTAPAVQVK